MKTRNLKMEGILAFTLCLLPFAGRPFFFDDFPVVATAEAARQHPLHPYDFRLNFGLPGQLNWAPGSLPATTNPPLSAWALAPATRQQNEWPFHAIVFILALLGLWGVQRLSAFFLERPARAAVLVAFSPAYFLTSLTLYPHLFYFVFAVWALCFFLRMRRDGGSLSAIGLALSLLLAAWSLHSWPLLLVVGALLSFYSTPSRDLRRWIPVIAAVCLFGVLYGLWCLWETRLYGLPHLLATFRVRAYHTGPYPWKAALLPLVFMAGSAPFVAIGWFHLRRLHSLLFWILLAIGSVLAALFHSSYGGFTGVQSVLLAVLFSTGLAFVFSVLLMIPDATRSERILIAWFGLEFLFVQKFLVYPSAHHLLLLLIPAALLAVRMAERAKWRPATMRTSLMVMAVFTLILAQADQREARIGPELARQAERSEKGENYYWGNTFSGFSYYLDQAGWKAFDRQRAPQPGDRVLVPQNLNSHGPTSVLRQWPYRVVALYEFTGVNPLRTLSLSDSAGWYSASLGALPFSLSTKPIEIFVLLEYMS